MALTVFTGRDNAVTVAANTTVNAMPAVADTTLRSVTVAEWDAGRAIECSIRRIGLTGDAKNTTDQFLCDKDRVEFAGPVEWSIDPLEIMAGDPQAQDPWLKSLTRGQVLYLGQRYGIPHTTQAADGQIVNQLTKVEISNVEWVPVEANENGDKFMKRISFAVKQNEIDAVMGPRVA